MRRSWCVTVVSEEWEGYGSLLPGLTEWSPRVEVCVNPAEKSVRLEFIRCRDGVWMTEREGEGGRRVAM